MKCSNFFIWFDCEGLASKSESILGTLDLAPWAILSRGDIVKG